MPSFPPFLFMSTAQEGRLSSKRRFPALGTYAPALLNPASRRSVRRHRNRGSYRPQSRANCGRLIQGLTEMSEGHNQRGPGRPQTRKEWEDLVLRMAEENRTWGYRRIQGAIGNLGYKIARSTIADILRRHGIEPAPD